MTTSHQPGRSFTPARWGVVLKAARQAEPEAHEALGILCQTYWFDRLSRTLGRPRGEIPCRELAAAFGTTEAAVKVAVQRVRAQYRALLRAEVAHAVLSPEEIDEEIRHLFAMFAG